MPRNRRSLDQSSLWNPIRRCRTPNVRSIRHHFSVGVGNYNFDIDLQEFPSALAFAITLRFPKKNLDSDYILCGCRRRPDIAGSDRRSPVIAVPLPPRGFAFWVPKPPIKPQKAISLASFASQSQRFAFILSLSSSISILTLSKSETVYSSKGNHI
ncbi:hypothetical protein SDJN03_25311, partial [Cucurbita argyrosperma subsp. sororia]